MFESESVFDKEVEAGIIRNRLYIIFGGIFLGLVMYYGIDDKDDKNEEFFEQGNGVNAEYQILYAGKYYHLGEMVSHWANIAILTMVGILISWITYYAIEARIWK